MAGGHSKSDHRKKMDSLDAAVLAEDGARLAKRLRRLNRCLINPRWKAMQYWDFVTIFGLLFTMFVTPYEVRRRRLVVVVVVVAVVVSSSSSSSSSSSPSFLLSWGDAPRSKLHHSVRQVSMLWGEGGIDALFGLNQLISIIFIIDMVINFFLPFREPLSHGGGTVKEERATIL